MADDRATLVGTWQVKVKGWSWEYTFTDDGKIAWRDLNSNEKGTGRWSLHPQMINMVWDGSSTTESVRRPLVPTGQKGWYNAPYYTGPYDLTKGAAPAASPIPSDLTPGIGEITWDKYVDQYVDIKYDLNFKFPKDRSFAYSSILRVRYADATELEIDFEKEFSTTPLTPDQLRDAMVHAKIGRGGRIFPTVLNANTVPRLWAAREDALALQEEDARLFMGIAIAGTMAVLTTPAMPGGMAMAGSGTGKPGAPALRAVRRLVPGAGVKVAAAPIRNGMVKVGAIGEPGNLWGSIQVIGKEIVYKVDFIILQGKGEQVAVARATHRAMIQEAARTARAQGQSTFKMMGTQANQNFVRHADDMARTIGVPGSGVGTPSALNQTYVVILDVAKALAQ